MLSNGPFYICLRNSPHEVIEISTKHMSDTEAYHIARFKPYNINQLWCLLAFFAPNQGILYHPVSGCYVTKINQRWRLKDIKNDKLCYDDLMQYSPEDGFWAHVQSGEKLCYWHVDSNSHVSALPKCFNSFDNVLATKSLTEKCLIEYLKKQKR